MLEAAPCPLPARRYGAQVPLPVSSVRPRAAQVARMDDYGATQVAVVDPCWRGTCRLAVAVVRTRFSPTRFWVRYRMASRSKFGSSQQGQTVGPSSDTTSVAPQLVPLPWWAICRPLIVPTPPLVMTPAPCSGHDTASPTHAAGRPLIATPALADVTTPPCVVNVPRVATRAGMSHHLQKVVVLFHIRTPDHQKHEAIVSGTSIRGRARYRLRFTLFVVRFLWRRQAICYVTSATRKATLKPFIDPRKAKQKNQSQPLPFDHNGQQQRCHINGSIAFAFVIFDCLPRRIWLVRSHQLAEHTALTTAINAFIQHLGIRPTSTKHVCGKQPHYHNNRKSRHKLNFNTQFHKPKPPHKFYEDLFLEISRPTVSIAR